MKILYSPQVKLDEKIEYIFKGDKITASFKGVTDVFDFTGMPDGELSIYDTSKFPCTSMLITSLEIQPIISAKRDNGVLSVVLLHHIDSNAPYSDRFPDWMEV